MTNIHDVAKTAGVSISTVSRVVNGNKNVLPETRERVLQVIRALDYHPNKLAQQFRSQQTNNISVIIPEIGNTFYSDILLGIESILTKSGYSIFIVNSHENPSVESRTYELLTQKQIDGIITFSIGIDKKYLKELAEQYPIVVGCKYFASGAVPNVTIDNLKATKDITSYMLNLGHRKICYLAGPKGIPIYNDRLEGFLEALAERGIEAGSSMIVHCDSTASSGYEAVSSLINDAGSRFSAIVSSGDIMAFGAIRALKDRGVRVPEDVAISGFDDIELSSLCSPSLTTVRQPKYQIGVRAAEKLLDLIAGKTLVSSRDTLSYDLIIRESSGSFVGNLS